MPRSSREHLAIETRERGCIANKSGRDLSVIEVKVATRESARLSSARRRVQSRHDLRGERFALGSDLRLLIRSNLERRCRRCNFFAGKCAERCDVWRACDTLGLKRSPTGLDSLIERCRSWCWNSRMSVINFFLTKISRHLSSCKLDH